MLFLFLLALGVRLFYWYLNPMQERDGIVYIWFAEEFFGSTDFSYLKATYHLRPPGLFLGMWSLMYCGMSAAGAGMFVCLVSGSLLPPVIYLFAKELRFSLGIALLSGLLACVHASLIRVSAGIMRDMPYLFFAGCFAVAFVRMFRQEKWYHAVFAAFLLYCTLMFRLEAGELVVVSGICFSFVLLFSPRKKQNLLLAAVFFGSLLLFIFMPLLIWHNNTNIQFFYRSYGSIILNFIEKIWSGLW